MSALASSAMPRRLPPGCIEDRDRHGNIRIYFRAKGRPKVRLRGTPWTPEFMAEYEAAKGIDAPFQAGHAALFRALGVGFASAILPNAPNTSALMHGRNMSAEESLKAPLTNRSRPARPSSSVTSRFPG